jgi:hypothetical protein
VELNIVGNLVEMAFTLYIFEAVLLIKHSTGKWMKSALLISCSLFVRDLPSAQVCSSGAWSVIAEWLGGRTLNQRVLGSNPGEGTQCCICEQDSLKIHSSG